MRLTIHYHGTPITPVEKLYELSGRHFCVSFAHRQDTKRAEAIAQTLMLDNGAFSAWRIGKPTDWPGFYSWCDPLLDRPTTWAVIPDTIEGTEAEQDELIRLWPHGYRGAPVWHMHESLDRLAHLTLSWPLVCIGSSGEFATVLAPAWCARMDAAWSRLVKHHRRTPPVHMLRGMQLVSSGGNRWPFYSVDSTDIARNHNRDQNTPAKMAAAWDSRQCAASFRAPIKQEVLL